MKNKFIIIFIVFLCLFIVSCKPKNDNTNNESKEIKHTITYILDGGELYNNTPEEYIEGVGIDKLPIPFKDGYIFLGWYIDNIKYESISDSLKSDITFTAKWEKNIVEHTITYILDGGLNPNDAPTKYVEGVGIKYLPTPTKDDYDFMGWYIGNELYTNIDETKNYDVILTAKWEKKITFALSNNSVTLSDTITIIPSSSVDFDKVFIKTNPVDAISVSDGIIKPLKTGTIDIVLTYNNYDTKFTISVYNDFPDVDENLVLSVNSMINFGPFDNSLFNIQFDDNYLTYLNNQYLITNQIGESKITIYDLSDQTRYKEINVTITNNTSKNERPEFRISKNYVTLDSTIPLRLSNYSDLSEFDIIYSSDNIISVNERNIINPLNTGNVTIYIRHKTDFSCMNKFELEVISILPKIFVSKDKFKVDEVSYLNISNLSDTYEKDLSEYIITLDNDNVILENYALRGVKNGKTKITFTSIHNPLVTSSYSVEVTDSFEKVSIYINEDYNGLAGVGDQFHISLNNNYKLDDFTLISSDETKLRVTAEGLVTIVEEGFMSLTVYETESPANKFTYRIYVNGKANIDYISRLLNLAIGEKGYTERWSEEAGAYVNDTKYNHWYNMEGAWCAMFVSWNWYHAGLSNDLLLKYASCSLGMAWCEEKGIFKYKETYTPKSGDIVFFLSSGSSHTGIVVYCDGTYVYTIEGNASNRVDVWRWSVKDARITGYATPDYPEYEGTPEDFAWIMGKDENDEYWWNNVPEKQPMT